MFDGRTIRRFRQVSGFKQEALAEKLGVSQGMLSKWERDIVRPSPAYRQRLLELIRDTGPDIQGSLESYVSYSVGRVMLLNADHEVAAASPSCREWLGTEWGKALDPDLNPGFRSAFQSYLDLVRVPARSRRMALGIVWKDQIVDVTKTIIPVQASFMTLAEFAEPRAASVAEIGAGGYFRTE